MFQYGRSVSEIFPEKRRMQNSMRGPKPFMWWRVFAKRCSRNGTLAVPGVGTSETAVQGWEGAFLLPTFFLSFEL